MSSWSALLGVLKSKKEMTKHRWSIITQVRMQQNGSERQSFSVIWSIRLKWD